ncbi:hypothetical protein [Actinacidiphila alni]|uniref:hypothetical protein n=1 Tax=Actinacidiphila alni TaxID=380248 RepID=UPI0015A55E76|nr:hypothetical protein [Actinacidiphila alni]
MREPIRRTTVARIKSSTLVTGLTAGAIVIIAVLAAQAAGSAPDQPAAAARPSSSATKSPSTKPTPKTYPVPADSGTGRRVVYSISGKRVWLVGEAEKVQRTYTVVAGNVAPSKGIHRVFSRRASGIGGDGAQVEHVVLFATTGGINVGFSAATNGSTAPPDPDKKTAAIRETRLDGTALWQIATIGSTVYVVK